MGGSSHAHRVDDGVDAAQLVQVYLVDRHAVDVCFDLREAEHGGPRDGAHRLRLRAGDQLDQFGGRTFTGRVGHRYLSVQRANTLPLHTDRFHGPPPHTGARNRCSHSIQRRTEIEQRTEQHVARQSRGWVQPENHRGVRMRVSR